MMNISYRGVELHRYRLQKLQLSQEENLSKFYYQYKNIFFTYYIF
jgi:hypothetical protein